MLSPEEIETFIDGQIPVNTKKKTINDLKLFRKWLAESVPDENRDLHCIAPAQLDDYLRSFFITVRKSTGEQYEPDTLKCIQNSLDRHLASKTYGYSLLRGDEFRPSRVLWQNGSMGTGNPKSLINAIWWRNNFFGIRGRDEHHKMRWGDVLIEEEVDGKQYMSYKERDTKTRKDPRDERAFSPRIYATPDDPSRCPVQLLLLYTHKRPLSMCQPDAPFYLQSLNDSQLKANTIVWFKQAPLGIHSLGSIMKTMSLASNIPGKKTNHSGRKTTIKRLREASVEACDIVQLTGHKNVQTINNYSDVSTKKQKQMSDILVTTKPATVSTAPNPSGDAPQVLPLLDIMDDDFDDVIASIETFERNEKANVANYSPRTVANNVLFGAERLTHSPNPYSNAVMYGSTMNSCTFNITVNINSK